jgi:hypothetical protein
MSEREVRRVEVLNEVQSGRRTVAAAASVLGVSERQAYRLLAKYQDGGGAALSLVRASWFGLAKQTALAGFANHLAKDQYAVEAALTLPWSPGQVEGQVHGLKPIKRQMYGRAGDLLRLRVLHKT